MPFLFLLLLIVCCLPDHWSQPAWLGFSPVLPQAYYLPWFGVGLIGLVASALSSWIRTDLRNQPERRDMIAARYGRIRFYFLLFLLAYYVAALWVLGWGWAVQSLGEMIWGSDPARGMQFLPGSEILLLAPFVGGLVLSWLCFYDADRALHESVFPGNFLNPFWSRRAYVVFRLRQNLGLLAAPLVMMIAVKVIERTLGGNELTALVITAALAVAVIVGFPWILRVVLGLKPLPEGSLRDRLTAAARRLKFRCSNILLWETNGGVANAMIAGVLPSPRYVLLSDKLLTDLSPGEVEAVFGHEVGHAKHHHMLLYVGFLPLSLCAVLWLGELVGLSRAVQPTTKHSAPAGLLSGADPKQAIEWERTAKGEDPPTGLSEDWSRWPFVGFLVGYIFVVFGFLSRRCERQADVFGCRAVSCGRQDCLGHEADVTLVPGGAGLCATGIRTFISALEKVASGNGMSRKRPGWLASWQHSTPALRVEFLKRLLADPSLEADFQKRVNRLKWALVLGVVMVLGILWFVQTYVDALKGSGL